MKTLTKNSGGFVPILLLAATLLAPAVIFPANALCRAVQATAGPVTVWGLGMLLLLRAPWSPQGCRRFVTTGPNIAIVLLITWATLSYFFNTPAGGRGQKIAFVELLRLTTGAAAYFTALYTFRSRLTSRLASFLLPAAGLLVALTGLLGFAPAGTQAASAAFGNKQLLAASLGVLLPVCVAFAWKGTTLYLRRFSTATSFFLGAALLLTANRTSWVAAFVGLCVVAVLGRSSGVGRAQGGPTANRRWLVPAVATVMVISVVFASPGARSLMRDRVSPAAAAATLGARLHLWAACGQMIRERPLTGAGIGSFAWKASGYTHDAPSAAQVEWQGYSLSSMAHNEYLQFGAELGLIGLGLYLAILVGFFFHSIRVMRRVPLGTRRWLLLACVGAVSAQCVDALANPAWRFLDISPLLWLLLGLGTAVTSVPSSARSVPVFVRDIRNIRLHRRLAIGMMAFFLMTGWGYRAFGADPPAGNASIDGIVPTSDNDAFTGVELAAWINDAMPDCKYRLVILTECFGGHIVKDFNGQGATAVMAATNTSAADGVDLTSGESVYGAYDIHAANSLLPTDHGTAAKVHADGTAGRAQHVPASDASGALVGYLTEVPSTGGALPLSSFSLDHTSREALQNPFSGLPFGRHIIVYAGLPEALDINIRDMIRAHFAGEFNTLITTLGGTGGDGWDKPATKPAMQQAIAEIGRAIEGSNVRDHEQLILVVLDHGNLDNEQLTNPNTPQPRSIGGRRAPAAAAVIPGSASANFPFQTFRSSDLDPVVLKMGAHNQPGFTFFINLYSAGLTTTASPFPPGTWTMILHHPSAGDFALNTFSTRLKDTDGNGIIGNSPGEGISLFFPIDTATFIQNFFDVAIGIEIMNKTSFAWPVDKVTQETGPISKGTVPEDVTKNVLVTRSGFRYARGTGRFVQQVTVQNTSSVPLQFPLFLALDNLSSNADLAGKNGVTAGLPPLGSPFINIPTGAGNMLNPGQSASFVLQFSNPSQQDIIYSTRVLANVSRP